MDREQWEKIKKILYEASDLPEQERESFLDKACAGDEAIRYQVESLLARARQTEGFLDRSAIEEFAEEIVADRLPSLIGKTVAQYRLESLIGVGGMGEVYQAYDQKLERKAAIKILPAGYLDSPDHVLRFAREARAASSLNHPNIITVYDTGMDEGIFYIAYELVEGHTLRQQLSDSPFEWPEAVRIAVQIADALTTAHTARIIHRDIKPENVMLRNDGLVKILDFGIAKRFDSQEPEDATADRGENLTLSNMAGSQTIAGKFLTLDYASPEQVRLESTDSKTDVFSFGLVLYEMLAGRHPYSEMTPLEKRDALLSNDEMPNLGDARKEIPTSLIDLVTFSLKKNRTERPPMAAVLEALKQLKPIGQRDASKAILKSFKTLNANRVLNQSIALYGADQNRLLSPLTLWTICRHSDIEWGDVERNLVRKSLWRSLFYTGVIVLVVAPATFAIAAWLSAKDAWIESRLREGHTAAVRRVIFSPDGRKVVSVSEDNHVMVWDFEQRKLLKDLGDHNGFVTSVEFSPDGKLFATGSYDHSVIVWNITSLEKVRTIREHRSPVGAVAFSRNGQMLATSSCGLPDDCRTVVWDTNQWQKIHEFPDGRGDCGNILFSPDSRMLMCGGGQWDLNTGHKVSDAPLGNWSAFSPDGNMFVLAASGDVRFYATSRPGEITGSHLISMYEFSDRGQRAPHEDFGRSVAFSPTGDLVATAAENILLWDPHTRSKLGRFDYDSIAWSVAFSPDGRWLISGHGDGMINVWDVQERRRAAAFNGHGDAVRGVSISSDGKYVASAGQDGAVILWKLLKNAEGEIKTERAELRGQKEAVWTEHKMRVNRVAFSTDNKWIASWDQLDHLFLWDVEGRTRKWSRHFNGGTECLAISPDGNWLATSLRIHESESGREVFLLQKHIPEPGKFEGAEFSSDGRMLAGVGSGSLFLIETGTWRLIDQKSIGPEAVIDISFSHDGTKLVTGGTDGRVILWRTSPLGQIATLGKHDARIKDVAFSPNTDEVATAGDDLKIKLWDINKPGKFVEIGAHASPVHSLAFSRDGKYLVSGEFDRTVRVYTRHRLIFNHRWD